MSKSYASRRKCQICNKEFSGSEVLPAELVRSNIVDEIKKEHPDWSSDGYICLADLHHYRGHYIQALMEKETGELPILEQGVMQAMMDQEVITANANIQLDRRRTVGERAADKIASFGGSWLFIGIFTGTLFIWILTNSMYLLWRPFDPFPYILLNLFLSCLAAIQAPIIMMSQNRQEMRDRLQAENDYKVNLKAELEIRLLNDKIDRLIGQQWHRLMEIQQIQTDFVEELTRTKRNDGPAGR